MRGSRMKTSNHILKTCEIKELNKSLEVPNIKIVRGGRYFAIGDKWVTSSALSSRIQNLAKTLEPKDQEEFNHLVDNFIKTDRQGYKLLKDKKIQKFPHSVLTVDVFRLFKTAFRAKKPENYEKLLSYKKNVPEEEIPTFLHTEEDRKLFLKRHKGIRRHQFEPLMQLQRYYGRVLETNEKLVEPYKHLTRPDGFFLLDGYTHSGALLFYLSDLDVYINSLETKDVEIVDQVRSEIEFAYILSVPMVLNPDESHRNLQNQVLKELQKRITELPASDEKGRPCVLIPGGYKQHGVMFKVEKNQNNTFSFTVINTGGGADLNFLSSVWTLFKNQRLTVQDVVYSNLTLDHLSKGFLKNILQYNGDFPNESSFSEFINRSLMKNGTEKQSYGRQHKAQIKGSCALKSVSSSIHERLGDKLYNRFKALVTETEIREIEKLQVEPEYQKLKEDMLAAGKEILQHRSRK